MNRRCLVFLLLTLMSLLIIFRPSWAQDRKPAEPPVVSKGSSDEGLESKTKAVTQFVEQIKRNPPKRSNGANRVGLYLIHVTDGAVTLVADEPDAGLNQCGSPAWSHDGRSILFDATPGTAFQQSHVKALALGDGHLVLTDLGAGNCPTFSSDDGRVAFLINPGAMPNAEAGVWLMEADGSNRRFLGSYGVPKWSPRGQQMMIISFSRPREVTIMDSQPEKSGVMRIAGYQIHSVTNWADDRTIIGVIGTEGDAAGTMIALIDTSDPSQAKIKEILWKKPKDISDKLHYPVISSATGRCVFVREGTKGMALYTFVKGRADVPNRLEPKGFDHLITGLAYSPDGRYVLFSSDRTE